MSYVDAWFDRDADRIHVVERVEGRREYREYPATMCSTMMIHVASSKPYTAIL